MKSEMIGSGYESQEFSVRLVTMNGSPVDVSCILCSSIAASASSVWLSHPAESYPNLRKIGLLSRPPFCTIFGENRVNAMRGGMCYPLAYNDFLRRFGYISRCIPASRI